LIETVTHAKLRAEQGDLVGARSILRAVLRRSPDHHEARELLERYSRRQGTAPGPEPVEPVERPESASAAELRDTFAEALGKRAERPDRRVERLRRWLAEVRRAAE
jgi:hypothetical protein